MLVYCILVVVIWLLYMEEKRPKTRLATMNPKLAQLKRVRAIRMANERIHGVPVKVIAQRYNLDRGTVLKELKYAADNGLIDQLEERILNELVPLAIDTYKEKMREDKDAFVAKDVLTNLARLSEKMEKRKDKEEGTSLEAYLKIRATKTTTKVEGFKNAINNFLPKHNSSPNSEEVIEADVAAHSPTITELTPEPSETEED